MVKGEKRAREKRLIKKRNSLLEKAKEHRIKTETEKGRKDTTPEYWLGESKRFEQQAEDIAKLLEKMRKKRRVK